MFLRRLINRWVILGAVAVGGLLWLFWMGVMWLLQPSGSASQYPTAAFTVIPAPTQTATPQPDALLTPSPTAPGYRSEEGIGVGVFVQITGTDGDGLRIRSGPGTTYDPLFLGMDSEVFEVKDGPKEADGFTWWYLVAPYDEARSGWAASKYLAVVSDAP